ncbi:carbohydrate-binding module family 50 protein [Apiospora arundinis]
MAPMRNLGTTSLLLSLPLFGVQGQPTDTPARPDVETIWPKAGDSSGYTEGSGSSSNTPTTESDSAETTSSSLTALQVQPIPTKTKSSSSLTSLEVIPVNDPNLFVTVTVVDTAHESVVYTTVDSVETTVVFAPAPVTSNPSNSSSDGLITSSPTSSSPGSSSSDDLTIVVSTFDIGSDVPRPSAAACDASSSTYTVKKGDTCYKIAQAHGLTPTDILHANPQMNNDCDLIDVGQVICLPGSGGDTVPTSPAFSSGATPTDSTSTQETSSTTASSQPPTPTTTTNPEEGDNSSSNGNESSSSPSTNTSASTPKTGCALRHTVIPGDTCHDMWTKYSLTQDEFLSLNPRLSMRPDGYCGIAVGDVVCVSGSSDGGSGNGGGGASPPPSPSNHFTGSLSVLSVIPVTETDKKAVERASPAPVTEESRRLPRWLPVTFQTSTVRETGDE